MHSQAVALRLATFLLAWASLCCGQTTSPATQPSAHVDWQIQREAESIRVTRNGRPVLLYRYKGAPKPYLKELYTPAGVQVLLDSPPDHVHHRGLMFAVAVDGVDFWSETDQSGKQVSSSLTTAPPVPGRDDEMVFLEHVSWRARDDKELLHEARRIDVHRAPEIYASGATLLTWRALLTSSNADDAQLAGSHYFGLGMRFVAAMDKNGRFISSDRNAVPEVVRGDEQLYTGAWCAYTASMDGHQVTVALFDRPENKRPATWFTMKDPFAYISATWKLHEEPLTLKPAEPLYLTYGVAAWDGQIAPEQIAKTYEIWLELLASTQPDGQTTSMPAGVHELLRYLK